VDRTVIKDLGFGSFMKLSAVMSASLGAAFGLFIFIAGLLGGEVRTSLGRIMLPGAAGGAASLVVAPLFFAVFGLLSGLAAYLPFRFILKISKGISLYGRFEWFRSEELPVTVTADEAAAKDHSSPQY